MSAYVYILEDKDGRFYIGSTQDLERRLRQHKNVQTQTTRNMNDPVLVLSQEYVTLTEARFVERRLKRLKRKDYIRKMIGDGRIKMQVPPL